MFVPIVFAVLIVLFVGALGVSSLRSKKDIAPVVKSYCDACKKERMFRVILGTREATCKNCGSFKSTYDL